MPRRPSTIAALLVAWTLAVGAQDAVVPSNRDGLEGWVTHSAAAGAPVVLLFRRSFDLESVPDRFPVKVSGDNAFTLFVNGRRVLSGPSTSDIAHWRYAQIDLQPYLRPGRNVVTARVWNFVQPEGTAPAGATAEQRQAAWEHEMVSQTGRLAQQSAGTGFWLSGTKAADKISTVHSGWDVAIDRGYDAVPGPSQIGTKLYYVATAPEVIDTRIAAGDISGSVPDAAVQGWEPAREVASARGPLIADPLPPQKFAEIPSGHVVSSTSEAALMFPEQSFVVPAHSEATLVIARDALVSAYPELRIRGGRDARIRMTYAEAPYDEKGRKGDRNQIENRHFFGIHDEIIANGQPQSVMPLEWRTWRYLEIRVQTQASPLTLEGLRTWETGYPFEQNGYFRSNDPELDRIWQIGWRTALVDAHDTYMDSAYWEQLQYVGDTRLQMLISYAVSGDNRLAAQAIDAFGASDVDGGLIEGAWPSRGSNAIAPFSLLWVGILHDWMTEQSDQAVVRRNLPRMRRVIDWFSKWRTPSGLLGRNPQWNFVDWVGQDATDRTRFPSYGKSGESCLTSILYLGALKQAAELENALGEPALGHKNAADAAALSKALRARCYVPDRKLFADNPDLDTFSQQMNALAVLYDVAKPREAKQLLERITTKGGGIDAPPGMYASSYYFAWYLGRAFAHAGMSERYVELLRTWRDLLALNYTTWPEEKGDTRSDSHAWSAHPTADLLRIVAGIGPGARGFDKVRIAPALGSLTKLDAAAMTPRGLVRVEYRIADGQLHAVIHKPSGLDGWFEWRGRRYPLMYEGTEFTLSATNGSQ